MTTMLANCIGKENPNKDRFDAKSGNTLLQGKFYDNKDT